MEETSSVVCWKSMKMCCLFFTSCLKILWLVS